MNQNNLFFKRRECPEKDKIYQLLSSTFLFIKIIH